MDRFYLPADEWSESPLLRGEEAHHCVRVMRKRPGNTIEIFDGRGQSARAEILESGKDRVALRPHGETRRSSPARPQITLAVGIPKGKTMDSLIRKAVELGISEIRPLTSEHGMVSISDGRQKRAKWQRVAMEACKQCGQNFLPEIATAETARDFLASGEAEGLALVAALRPEARAFSEILRGGMADKVTLLIGPEGDFSAAEYEAAFSAGFKPVGLGDLVLRVETAVLYALSVIRYEGKRQVENA